MPKIHYDPEVKILSIRFAEAKSIDSDVKDNIVFDYDAHGHIINIDVMQVNLEDLVHTEGEKGQSHKTR